MNFRKVNNIAGWIVGVIASMVYILTTEMRGSFWDTGEFISACYKVQLPHPPGAPLFVLLGRFFIILFGDDPMTAAKAVNVMNAVASGLTIMFLFWTITHFARKLMTGFREEPNSQQMVAILGAGLVGGLAYTFTDSFWFSAVEGEVYALSSLFTALAFWAMLRWERADDAAGTDRALRNRADRWIIFLFFSLGLSIGIHLLGLLVIPAAVMIYYYKRYNYTRKGAIWAFIIGCLLTGVVQVVVIKWSMQIAGWFDKFFVNGFNLPFFSGFAFFFVLLAVLVWWGLRVASRNNWSFLRLGLWCFAFMMLGYSTYITTMERSNANPALDMNNVDNPMSLVYYLGREQYGSQPLLMGPHFVARYEYGDDGRPKFKEGKTRYVKGKDKYEVVGKEMEYVYDSRDIQLFPRVWDPTNEQGHADFYMSWLNLRQITAQGPLEQVTQVDEENGYIYVRDQNGKTNTYTFDPVDFRARVRPGQLIQNGTPLAVEAPTYMHNIEWFITYQMGFMYWRYFMWNFAGRQNDLQGFGNARDGNWISGISFIDNARLGDQSKLPNSIRDNEATNKLYLLPFILGIVGCVFHFLKDRRDWIVTFLLFFFTGIAIVLYLNQPGSQPRERDYAFAGSFYAYAIWIGLSVIALVRMAREVEDKLTFNNVLIYGSATAFLIALLSNAQGTFGGAFISSFLIALVYAVVTLVMALIVRAIGKNNLRTTAILATLLCLATPAIMASQEWGDHDRSKKLLAPDIARDYLEGCPQNAILFTFGDNDTYPLWYAQEVEGVRPDVRIVNTSLLGIDWYVNQLRYKVNQSAPFDVIWSEEQVRGLAYIVNDAQGNEAPEPLYNFMKDKVGRLLNTEAEHKGEIRVRFPSQLTVPVDVNYVKSAGLVNPGDSILPEIQVEISPNKNYLSLDQLTMLNILASSNWRRPICFTSPYGELGFGPYLRQIGLIYQLVPVRNDAGRDMDLARTSQLLMEKFRSGNANRTDVYFDEENRRHLLSIRQTYAIAASVAAEQGKKDEAIRLLNRAESLIHPESLPYAMVSGRGNFHNRISMMYLDAALKAGHTGLANKLKTAIRKDLNEQKAYYEYLRNDKEELYPHFMNDEDDCNRFLQLLDQWEKQYGAPTQPVQEIPGRAADTSDTTRRP